jgi:predicted O-methyltransferase YrrM
MIIDNIKKKSIEDNIPILRDNTLKLIVEQIEKHNVKTILEIGTAYGYSSNQFSKIKSIQKIATLELNKNNYDIAYNYLKNNKKIELININAFEFNPKQNYDLILVDGPKSHQEILVDKYLRNLNENGIMIIDNIFLKKFDGQTILTKNQKKLTDNVRKFHD